MVARARATMPAGATADAAVQNSSPSTDSEICTDVHKSVAHGEPRTSAHVDRYTAHPTVAACQVTPVTHLLGAQVDDFLRELPTEAKANAVPVHRALPGASHLSWRLRDRHGARAH